MQYNTARRVLHVREYGRNTQRLVEKLCEIEDPVLRLEMAHKTVEMLRGMNNQYKSSDNSDQKIWDMLYYISDFKLNVDSPFPPPPKDNFEFTPSPLPYAQSSRGRKGFHLGKNVSTFINIARATEDNEKKAYMTKLIAHYIRVAYLTWHNELPSDEYISSELKMLSNGELAYDASTAPKGNHYAQLVQQQQQQQKTKSSNHRRGKRRK